MGNRERWYQAIPLLILLLFTWLRAAAMLSRVTDPDPGLFEAFAYHLLHGKILYADIWDHKPPLIFYLNLGFLKIFGASENGISYGSLLFCLLQTAVFYFLSLEIFKHKWTAFFGSLLFISTFFSAFTFGSGNYAEQYGVLFTTAGLLFLLRYTKNSGLANVGISGLFFGIAWWFKEPFIFSAIPAFLFLLFRSFQKKENFSALLRFGLMFLLPAFVLCNTMALTGSWDGYKEQLAHSRNYAIYSQAAPLPIRIQNNILGFIAMLPFSDIVFYFLFISGIIFLLVRKGTRIAGLLILGQQIADYFATGISGNRFFHYYLQSLPITILALIYSPVFIGNWIKKYSPVLTSVPMFLCVLLVFYLQKPWQNMAINPEKKFADPIVNYLRDNEYYKPRSIAMGGKDIGFYLLRAEGISAQRYIVPYPYHWIPMKGKPKHYRMSQDSAMFKENLPDYVIFSGTWSEMYQDCGLDSFVLKNYTEVAITDMMPGATAHLLKKMSTAAEDNSE